MSRSSGGRGRGGGRDCGGRSNNSNNSNSSDKSSKKPNRKGVYKDGHFVGVHRNQPVVTVASTTKAKNFEDLEEATVS